MKKYLPLFLVEVYLLGTLLIFFTGPINFNIKNLWCFLLLMGFYHLSFVCGYLVACVNSIKMPDFKDAVFSTNKYWVLFFVGALSVLIAYNNLMLSETIIPYGFFDNLLRGISDPGLVYSERMQAIEMGAQSDSRLFNIISIAFSFSKLLFIFYFIYFWAVLRFKHKIIAIAYSIFFVSSGLSAGVNSVIFIFFIFAILSLLTVLNVRNSALFNRILLISLFTFLIPLASFGYIMSQRGGGFDYFAETSTLGDISVVTNFQLDEGASIFDFLYYSFVWLDYYVTQGYYGFSLILDMDWNWTYGFGNSAFLQRQFFLLTGVDVSKLTFQSRVSHYWDESAQWHSFYGQFANDFGLYGMIVFLFGLGYFFSRVWQAALRKSFYGAALIPIFAIMFIFFPANNQVFAFIDMLSYFIVVNIFLFFENRKLRF